MKRLPFTLFFISLFFRLVLTLSPAYLACQLKKSTGESPLAGCPKGTLYVSPTDSSAHFSSIQETIDSLPSTGHVVVLIGEGKYFEMVNVTRSAPLTLLGQLDPATASIQAGNASQRNLVQIWNNLYVSPENGLNDEETAILTVAPSAGFSFGNVDFKAYNIDFENRAANYSIGQALVTSIMYANASFYGCTFASWQDTFYTGPYANAYVVDSIIFGSTDYLFGFGTAWFQSVTLANRGCGGAITAWSVIPQAVTGSGVYIADSRIIRSPETVTDTVTIGRCYLGRPWNEHAVAVFLRNYMDETIHPAGFTSWAGGAEIPDTTYYAEFDSSGLGGNTSARVPRDHILNSDQSHQYSLKDVFGGTPRWVDCAYQF